MSRSFPNVYGYGMRAYIGVLDPTLIARPFTVAYWMKANSLTGQLPYYVGRNGGSANGYYGGTSTGAWTNTAVGNHFTYTASVNVNFTWTLGTWFHFTLQTDGMLGASTPFSAQSWVNGSITAGPQTISLGAIAATTDYVCAGCGSWEASPHHGIDGFIADFALWDAKITTAQVAQLASGMRPDAVRTANLRGWWKMESTDSANEPNSYGDYPAMSIVGAIPFSADSPPYGTGVSSTPRQHHILGS